MEFKDAGLYALAMPDGNTYVGRIENPSNPVLEQVVIFETANVEHYVRINKEETGESEPGKFVDPKTRYRLGYEGVMHMRGSRNERALSSPDYFNFNQVLARWYLASLKDLDKELKKPQGL